MEKEFDFINHHGQFLPHIDSPDLVQHITIRLSDSLPRKYLRSIKIELEQFPESERKNERMKIFMKGLDQGFGSCLLRVPEAGKLVMDSLKNFDGERYRLIAWVVMPNHVHAMIQAINGWSEKASIISIKKYTAPRLLAIAKKNNLETHGMPPVWHEDYFDRYIRDDKHYLSCLSYIQQNPVIAGLAKTPELWRWSSAYRGPECG